MKIYTGFGDTGKTSLLGGKKVDKNNPQVELYGTLDELNSFIGLLLTKKVPDQIRDQLLKIQSQIFILSSEAAKPAGKEIKNSIEKIGQNDIDFLEENIDSISAKLEPLIFFILPGGSEESALSHICRTVCRRAERLLSGLYHENILRDTLLIYLNRLSDYFFVTARFLNHVHGIKDVKME